MRLHRPSRRSSPTRRGPRSSPPINGLRDDDREIIGARYFLDLSEAETAETLGPAAGHREVAPVAGARAAARASSRPRTRRRPVAEPRRALAAMDDVALEAALRDAGGGRRLPVRAERSRSDVAARVRGRDRSAGHAPTSRRGRPLGVARRPRVRRSLVAGDRRAPRPRGDRRRRRAAGCPGSGSSSAARRHRRRRSRRRPRHGRASSASPPPRAPASASTASGLGTEPSRSTRPQRLAGLDLVLPPDPAIGPPDAGVRHRQPRRARLVGATRPAGRPVRRASGC